MPGPLAVIVALKVKVLGQVPVKFVGSVLAVTLVTENGIVVGHGGDAEPTVVTADLVIVPAELVALMV